MGGGMLLIWWSVFSVAFSVNVFTDIARWMLAILLGIYFAEEDVFSKVKAWCYKNNIIMKFVLSICIMGMLMIFRQSTLGIKKFLYICDGVVPAYVILFSYVYIISIPYLRNVLCFLGKHSMNMFLTHTFIRAIYLQAWSYSFKFAFLDVLILVIETVLLSMLIEKLKDLLGYNLICSRIKNRVEEKIINNKKCN